MIIDARTASKVSQGKPFNVSAAVRNLLDSMNVGDFKEIHGAKNINGDDVNIRDIRSLINRCKEERVFQTDARYAKGCFFTIRRLS